MIDLKRSLLIVMAYPDAAINHKTSVFFCDRGLPFGNIMAIDTDCSVVESRNRVIRDIVIPRASRYEWFIFIDKDQSPVPSLTDPFLDEVKADVVGCEYNIGTNGAWVVPDNFHMGLCRIRSEMLVKIKPPWFMFEYSDDGAKIVTCECAYLRRKLLEQDAAITRRGWLEHDTSRHSWYGSA